MGRRRRRRVRELTRSSSFHHPQIYANDLDVSAEHVERLVQEVLGSDAITQSFLDEEVDAAKDAIKSLESLAGKCRTILKVRSSLPLFLLTVVFTLSQADCSLCPSCFRPEPTNSSTNSSDLVFVPSSRTATRESPTRSTRKRTRRLSSRIL